MDEFEKKYGILEDEKVKSFDRNRRMFCIYKDELFIAEPDLPFSHAVWFEKQGWISRDQDDLMNTIVRGYVASNGDVYFYAGYDFRINKEIESVFFKHLDEIVKKLELKPTVSIFGGKIKPEGGSCEWPPRKEYGLIKDNLDIGLEEI